MERHAALDILRSHEEELRGRGVTRAAQFGSTARDAAGTASDVDVLVDLDLGAVRDVYDYVGVVEFIETLFPVPIDVADRAALQSHVRSEAERDSVDAF